jgi:RNA recognition motif-containing protein
VGDLSNDVNDNTLNNAFAKYPSYCKCKVVRDRLSMKVSPHCLSPPLLAFRTNYLPIPRFASQARYGFIAFSDPEDYLKAWKEMDGKYVGNRPIRLMKCTDKFGGTKAVSIGARRGKELDKIQKNKGKPLDGRPVPW